MPCAQKTSVEPHLGQNLIPILVFFSLDLNADLVVIESTVSYGSSLSLRISFWEVWVF